MTWKRFTFIDLFAGIGGICLPFEQFSGDCLFSSEIDEACRMAYRANFGEAPYSDITRLSPPSVPDHDLLLAGFAAKWMSQFVPNDAASL